MTTEEHISRIAAKCRADILSYEMCGDFLNDLQRRALAALRSTIAAIGAYECMTGGCEARCLAQNIIAAWPEPLLT